MESGLKVAKAKKRVASVTGGDGGDSDVDGEPVTYSDRVPSRSPLPYLNLGAQTCTVQTCSHGHAGVNSREGEPEGNRR